MPSLLLLRHAKSDWADPGLPDHDRPLNQRGRHARRLVAQHLRAAAVDVDLVLCSTARRTRETWDGVRAGLLREPEVRFERRIYEATATALLELVRSVEPDRRTVMVIGHNPGLGELTATLLGDGDPDAIARLEEGFPTAALAMLSFDGSWAELRWHTGRLDAFVRPKDLPEV